MSDYTKITDFAAKDALAHLNPAKVITGTAHDNEYNAIATAIGTKADKASPTFTGTVTAAAATFSGAVTASTTLAVTGAATLASTLGVTGALTAAGAVTLTHGDTYCYGYSSNTGQGVVRFNITGTAYHMFDGSSNIIAGGPLNIPSAGASVFSGSITATAFNVSSDARKKKDVATITSALDKVSSLRGVGFKYIASDAPSLGFIAQEVAPMLPELVTADAEGFLSVNYGQLTAVLVEAIKELRAEVAALKAA